MFTAANKLSGGWEMREDRTGQSMFVPDSQADQMFAQGTAKKAGAGGGGLPISIGANAGDYVQGVPRVTLGTGKASDWTTPDKPVATSAPTQSMAPIGPPSSVAARNAKVAELQNTYGAQEQRSPTREQLTRVPSRATAQPQGQAQPTTGPLVQLVRTPGRKAGMRPSSATQQGIAPEQQRTLFDDAEDMQQRQIALAENNLTLQEEDTASRLFDAKLERLSKEDTYAKQQAANALKQEHGQQQQRKLQERVKALREQRVTPWAEDAGFGAVLLNAIAMAGGAYAAGMNGGPNMAADVINKAIDRDMQLKLQNKADRVDAAAEDRDEFARQFGLDTDQRKELEAASYKLASAAKLKEEMLDERLAYLRPQGEQAIMQLEKEGLDTYAKIAALAQQSTTLRYDPGSAGGVSVQLTPEGKLRQAQSAVEGQIADAQGKVYEAQGKAAEVASMKSGKIGKGTVMINGEPAGVIEDPMVYQAIQKQMDDYDKFEQLAQRQLQLQDKKKRGLVRTEDNAEWLSNRNRMVRFVKQLGENSDSDTERIMAQIGTDLDYVTDKNTTALKATMRNMAEERQSTIRQYRLKDAGGLPGRALRTTGEEFD